MEDWGVYICYMITLAIGVAVSTLMWLITRRLLYKSWICRALLSLLFAAIITPVEMRVGAILGPHASYVAPAGFAFLGDIRRGNAEWVVLSGILPMITVATSFFLLWSLVIYLRGRHKNYGALKWAKVNSEMVTSREISYSRADLIFEIDLPILAFKP